MTKNRQSAASNLSDLTRNQLQLFLSGRLGDGCIYKSKKGASNSEYYTNCKYEEYIDYKRTLLGTVAGNKSYIEHNGFCQTPIWVLHSHRLPVLNIIKDMNITEVLDSLDDLGLALWFYDDGSLHKSKLFYNLNTQKYSEEVHREILVPYFKDKWGIKVIPTIERKIDGRIFWYLRIRKYEGAFKISEILSKYFIPCYNYKIISSETIQKWSKLQEELKRIGKDYTKIHPHTLTCMMNKITL